MFYWKYPCELTMIPKALSEYFDFYEEKGKPDTLTLRFSGKLDTPVTARIWRKVVSYVRSAGQRRLIIDAAGITDINSAGFNLFLQLHTVQKAKSGSLEIIGLKEEFQLFFNIIKHSQPAEISLASAEKEHPFTKLGKRTHAVHDTVTRQITFIGESFAALVGSIAHPNRIRWSDMFVIIQNVGSAALPITALIGFLMGLIISFQSALTLQRFGAEIYVANLLGISIFRELGPLVTCILLAGRSGSAFAAELGTMKINEEIDALNTMGINPIRFLVVPRLIAAVTMAPLLTLFFGFFSLIGGAVVMLSMGYAIPVYTSRFFAFMHTADFIGGLVKAAVFSLLVAGIGCQRGLATTSGASAVGLSTTSAVVSGITLIAIADGIFAIIYYFVGV